MGFVGAIRDHDAGRHVLTLEYSAHPSAAAVIAEAVAEVATNSVGLRAVAASHRIGVLHVGEAALVVAVAADHRQAAFGTCAHLWTPSRSGCRCGNTNLRRRKRQMGGLGVGLSPRERRQNVDRVAWPKDLRLVVHGHPVAQIRAPQQHPGQFGTPAAQLIDQVADRDAGSHGELFGVSARGGPGGREIPHRSIRRAVSTVTSAADRAHRPRRLDEIRVVDPVACRFVPIAARQAASIPASSTPARSNARRSVSSVANRQLRNCPSAVSRVRLHVEQNGCDTEAMSPTLPVRPVAGSVICHSAAGDAPRGVRRVPPRTHGA